MKCQNESKSIFFISDEDRKSLGLSEHKKEMTMAGSILYVFELAKKEGKTELTLDEITIAYHNVITKRNNGKIKNKKDIAQKLFMMRGDGKDDSNADIELVPGKRGVYRLRKRN